MYNPPGQPPAPDGQQSGLFSTTPAVQEFVPARPVAEFVPGVNFQPSVTGGAGLSVGASDFKMPGLSASTPEFTPSAPNPQGMVIPQNNVYTERFNPGVASFQPIGQQQLGQDIGQGQGLGLQEPYSNQNPQMAEQMMSVQYASLLPHVARKQHRQQTPSRDTSYFTSEDLRKEMIGRQFATQILPEDPNLGIPAQVDNYHSLYPVEVPTLESGTIFGFPSVLYKGINVGDGLPYALRRVINVKLTDVAAMSVVEKWRQIEHPNIIGIKEVFTTKDFGDNSVVFAHDFHPLAQTLQARHLNDRNRMIEEPLLWSYIIQITSALRMIHNRGLACRVVDATKIVVSGRSRVMLGSTSIFEVLQYDESQNTPAAINHFQQKDLVALGRLVLLLACNTLTEMFREAVHHSMAHVSSHYSEDLFNLIRYLLSPVAPGRMGKSLNDLMPMIGARFYAELESQTDYVNLTESELSKEIQNGRLFRLITKLEFIVDRPEHKTDPRFGETGDLFLLKLLRDYIFHQSEESGQPWLDVAHVVQCLNHLDCGSPSKICLVTPDEKNVMIVSYYDLKQCLVKAYTELSMRE